MLLLSQSLHKHNWMFTKTRKFDNSEYQYHITYYYCICRLVLSKIRPPITVGEHIGLVPSKIEDTDSSTLIVKPREHGKKRDLEKEINELANKMKKAK